MEFKIAACGKCEAGTTTYESCYVPNGQCSKICQNAGKTCEVGRDDSTSECGKCLDAAGVDKSLVGSSCEPLPRGKCDTRCTKALSACTPNPTSPPQECGSCPGVRSAAETCRTDYGQCSTKCRNSGASCVPSSTNIPMECGGCTRGTTPSESCTPPGANGVCNDACTRPRAKCARAADGVVATMPTECGACATNASAACLPDEQCRVSMADAQGKELVPTRVTGTMTAQYDVSIKPNTPSVLHVIALHADKSCGATEAMAAPTVTVQDSKNSDKVKTAVTEEQAPATGGRQFAISITVPTGAGARYKVQVDSCCAALQMNLQTTSGGGGSGGNGDKSYNAQCIVWGDPHVITLDSMHYEFQYSGDYIMIKSLDDFQDSKLMVQARFVRMYNLGFDARTNAPVERISNINGFGASSGNLYTVKAAAVSEGDQTVAAYVYHYAEQARAKSSLFVVVKNSATSTTNTIDVRTLTSAPTTVPLEAGAQDSGTLALSGSRDVTITLQSGAVLVFNGFEATASMSANIAIKPSPPFYQNAGKVRGMCGDMDGQKNNDLHSRTDDTQTASEVAGASVGIGNDMCDVCNDVAKTWKVATAAESLFDYGTITGVAAGSLPTDDKMLPSLNDLASHRDAHLQGHVEMQTASAVDPAKLEQAKQSCQLLKPPFAADPDYQNCMNDFLVALQDVGVDHALSTIASFMNTQAQACRDSNGEDAAACSAAGAGCEALNGCSNMGFCDSGKCQCLPGRTGPDCSLPAVCDSKPCGRHGTCVPSQNPSQPFDCQCDRGFGGDTCQYIITSMGKAVKLADDAGSQPLPQDAGSSPEFTATKSQGLGMGTIAGIFVGIFLIGAAIMGGVVYYKKKNPGRFTMAPSAKPPLISNTSSDSEGSKKGASNQRASVELTSSSSPRGSNSKSYGRPPPSPRQYGAALRGQM